MAGKKGAKPRDVPDREWKVTLCELCGLPLCPHGHCINGACKNYHYDSCVDKYKFHKDKE